MKRILTTLISLAIYLQVHSQINSACIGNLGTPNPWPAQSASAGGYIPLGNFGAQNTFSISMWINPASVQTGITIIIDASHGGSANWVIQTLNSGATWTWGSGVFTLTPDTWQHLLLTYNNGSRKIFVNGTQVQSWSQSINYSGSPSLYLGNWPEGGRRFTGLIDELYITTGILEVSDFTPSEVISSPASNTFGLWHFDEGSGTSTSNAIGTSFSLNNWYWSNRVLNNNTGGENPINTSILNQGISYQAIARDLQGAPLVDTNMQVQFTLLADSLTGAAEYSETHMLSTNSLGLFTTAFGGGTPVNGTYGAINWTAGNKYLNVQIDTGNGWLDMGTSQLLTVPYALHSATSGAIKNPGLPVYADNAAAIAGGLTAGEMYRTASGDLKVVY
jgi:hypothetical protein